MDKKKNVLTKESRASLQHKENTGFSSKLDKNSAGQSTTQYGRNTADQTSQVTRSRA